MAKILTSRVDKLLSSMGYGSRNQISAMGKAGQLRLDGASVHDVSKRISISADLPDRLQIAGELLDPLPGVVILMHKPLGATCSHKEDGTLVYDLLPPRWRRRNPLISSIGRLDKETSGLLLLTDDGDLLHRLTSPKHHVSKTYRVRLDRPLTGTEGALFASGSLLLNGEEKPLEPADLVAMSDKEALLTITEGRYHQVRRMFAAAGNHVTDLHRESFGNLSLPEDLAAGQWSVLSAAQVASITAHPA
ncbi:pseudouridine synthase [Loktanella salsilacus]|uniref:pseudouridine synthase n=1 Tax=Loktanella salsilacus TaxID=195913 RepID=UPI003735E1BD